MPLLDTSHLIGLIRKDEQSLSVQKDLDKTREYQYISVITLFELVAGAYRSNQPGEKIREIEIIKEHVDIIEVTGSYADAYGILVNKLHNKGSRIGALDEIIAATAINNDGKMVTRDSHFLSCPGVEVFLY